MQPKTNCAEISGREQTSVSLVYKQIQRGKKKYYVRYLLYMILQQEKSQLLYSLTSQSKASYRFTAHILMLHEKHF